MNELFEVAELIKSKKAQHKKLAALTAYDYPMARILDEAGVDILLVGDSLGMVVLGYPDTTSVTMADMIHHTRAVARAKTKAWVIADMPYKGYETVDQALENAKALVEAGGQAVKMEGGCEILPQVQAILKAGIPVVAHLGMLPQHIKEEKDCVYHIKGKEEAEQQRLLKEAKAMDEAGVTAIVLELVKNDFTHKITEAVQAPTIGIGSGLDCDGQILVTHDLTGAFPWFKPRFVTSLLQVGIDTRKAVETYCNNVRNQK